MILFRDTYKSAYKDIEPDSELLSRILVKGLKEKKVLHRKWVYSFGTLAASFALVFCSVIGYMNYTDINEIPLVVDNTNAGLVSEPYINENPTENSNEKDVVKSNDTTTEKTEKNVSKQTVSEPIVAPPVISQEDAQEPKAEDVPSIASYEHMPASEPLGEVAYSENEPPLTREVSQIEEMPLSDYYQLIGFNVLEKINLPSDMLYSGENTVPYDKSSDKAMFSFFGDESRFANISFTKNIESLPQTDELENDYEQINGMYTINGTTDTYSFEILTNINKEEVKELADSLVK